MLSLAHARCHEDTDLFRRLFTPPDLAGPDTLASFERLLRYQSSSERSAEVLRTLRASLPNDVRGFVVAGGADEGYSFDAQIGYGDGLLQVTPANGPWRVPGPRLVPNLIAELFTSNEPGPRAELAGLGLREANSALVAPVVGRFEKYGALVLLRHGQAAFSEEELKLATRWASVLGEAQSQATELRLAKLSLVQFTRAFVHAFEAQDFTQLGHGERVTAYALALARALELPRPALADLYFAAMLHDIGKLGNGMDQSVEDLEHPQRGANMVAGSELLLPAAEAIRHHHEAWDGSGFPDGLRKEAIPLLARIVTVADTFDLLSSERGKALPLREVERALEQKSGVTLDPAIVALLINILRQGRDTQELSHLRDSDLPF